jgi:hypothetical protein
MQNILSAVIPELRIGRKRREDFPYKALAFRRARNVSSIQQRKFILRNELFDVITGLCD